MHGVMLNLRLNAKLIKETKNVFCLRQCGPDSVRGPHALHPHQQRVDDHPAENLFWDVLAEIASREDKTTNQMIAALHGELFINREDSPNFTSFLRVCCLRYLSLPRLDETADKQAASRTLLVPTVVPAQVPALHH